ncbi:phage gp37-like protein [Paucimonas lemoignei]|uniref:Phage gp37-like protein n=1 Tax=Paucimonas lemoignei TaxID=29443 RepID=A0A4R3HZ21_PAULE|nr:phage protein Gp37 [Paucimonas lemoignei]TCS38482.1 phage gp37-like protein [Paucimonas lemoignei]
MIGQLEDAIVSRIKAAQAANLWQYRLRTVDTYGGQIDESVQSTFQFPAVFVSFVGSKIRKRTGERGRIMEVKLALYIAARNPRNERATRHGDMHEPGSYQIAEDMVALLENQRLGMPMHLPLMCTDIKTLFVARKSDGHNAESILVVEFECEFGWEAALPECANVTEDDWLKTGQEFYVKPGDDNPDLTAETVHAQP